MKHILKILLPRSLRHQVAFLIGGLGFITIIIHSGIMFYHQYQLTKSSTENTIQQQLSLAESQIIDAFIYKDLYTLYQIASKLSLNVDYLQNIYVLDENSKYITDANAEKKYALESLRQKGYLKIKKEPIHLNDQLLGYIVYIIDNSQSRKELMSIFMKAFLLNLVIVLIGVIAGVRLSILIIRPLEELTEDIRLLKKKKMPMANSAGYSSDEVILLRKTLSHSLFMLWEQEQNMLIHERRALIGVMAAGLAHELKNPVMTIKLLVGAIHADDLSEEQLADKQIIEKESDRIVTYVNEFLDYSKPFKANRSSFQWETLINDCLELNNLHEPVMLLKASGAIQGWINSDFDKLMQVFQNLINNAREAGASQVELDIQDFKDEWILRFMDDAPMIDPEIREQIFHPFVTTKEEGTGLGLAICKMIIETLNKFCNQGRIKKLPFGSFFYLT